MGKLSLSGRGERGQGMTFRKSDLFSYHILRSTKKVQRSDYVPIFAALMSCTRIQEHRLDTQQGIWSTFQS